MDEFGPLSLQPYKGKGWFPQRRPTRLRATYNRPHGVKHLLAALDLKTDKLYGHVSKTKRHQDLLRFFQVLRRRFHHSERLYLILDNFSPHQHKKVKKWASENNVELVFTPTYASWLNRIECHFGPLRKFVLEGSDFAKHQDLGLAIQAYLRWRNKNKRKAIILREQNKIKVV
ncbi:transposase [Paenibacillus faecis]|uniref:transposase n=1 Tax=Paenibacillus faecis TaxID=862114 RepID=UPI002012021C|nr:transposase [Paenibacillus faecis]